LGKLTCRRSTCSTAAIILDGDFFDIPLLVLPVGHRFFGDAIYKMEFTFPHDADGVRLEFSSMLLDNDPSVANGSWGLAWS
jgi:hypothetical protein